MRINGRASIATDAQLLATMDVKGHVPKLGMLVPVQEAFIHSGKAPKRGRIWDGDSQIDRARYPRMGEVMFDHGKYESVSRSQMIEIAQDEYDNNVYPTDLDD